MPPEAKLKRCDYAQSVKHKHASTLERYAYRDGATIYLACGPAESQQKKRSALGKMVWRFSTGKDGLYDDNISPSLYAKAEGLPVKIWGFLADGHLQYWVLPSDPENLQKTCHMTGDRYQHLVETKFDAWRQECFGDKKPCHLVQDHEKCLWSQESLAKMVKAGCLLVTDFPKYSPDLNAIEGIWALLRQRLQATDPADYEDRPSFLIRLRRCVAWLNENKFEQMVYLCTNQKERADDVLKLSGAKTKW